MPIYEYECQECGRVFEKIQRFSDDPLTEYACDCAGREKPVPVKKLISAAAFHLKGSGWYVTDFRDGGKRKDGKSTKEGDGASSSKSESDSSKKPDSKPAAKSDSAAASSGDAKAASKSASG